MIQETKDLLDLKEMLDPKDLRETWDLLDQMGQKARLVQREPMDKMVLKVSQEYLEK